MIFAAGTVASYSSPTPLFEFSPATNTISQLSTPSGLTSVLDGDQVLSCAMLVLPTGQVLFSDGNNALWAFTPNGSPQSSWAPTINSITDSGATYTLTGTQLNGISEGAAYGDDAEMASNYPIVQLVSSSNQVYYARTFNWSSTGVDTGSTPETTNFTLPAGLPNGTYSLYVIANGIASTPVSFTTGTSTDDPPTVVNAASANPSSVTGTTTSLSVLGDDDDGESAINYTWSVASVPPGAPLRPSRSAAGSTTAPMGPRTPPPRSSRQAPISSRRRSPTRRA